MGYATVGKYAHLVGLPIRLHAFFHMAMQKDRSNKFKKKVHEIITEADTPAGRLFDILLFIAISLSVVVVMLESIDTLHERYGALFRTLEWIFTILFTIEYLLRLYSVNRPWRYATSFYGVVDLLAILPTYISIFFPHYQYLLIIRALRLMRIFRIFKLVRYLDAGRIILRALLASRLKIIVFLTFIVLLVTIIGAMMYLVEGQQNEMFSSIPQSIYWAIVTLTTVGYGDITPVTALGQFLSAIVMILGYAVIAVPTGIVSAEFIADQRSKANTQVCHNCLGVDHDNDAVYCKYCGTHLH